MTQYDVDYKPVTDIMHVFLMNRTYLNSVCTSLKYEEDPELNA